MDAPLGSAELAETDELKRLRRRAYGPDADIAGDAAAQARLFELEAAQRRQLTPEVDAVGWAPTPVPERVPVPEPVEWPRTASTAVLEGASAAPWWRRHSGLAILGAIVALALKAALVAWTSQLLAQGFPPVPTDTSTVKMPPVPDSPTRPDGVIEPDYVLALVSVGADADEPNDKHGTLSVLGLSADELRRYEDFDGLNVWSGESRYGTSCLLVAVPVQGLREGFGAEGCSPEGLDTVADLETSTRSLTRFVLRGDHVDVYVYERAAIDG